MWCREQQILIQRLIFWRYFVDWSTSRSERCWGTVEFQSTTFLLLYLWHYQIQQTRSCVLGGLKFLVNGEEYLPQHQRRDLASIVSSIGYSDQIPRHGSVAQSLDIYPYVCPGIWMHVKLGINVFMRSHSRNFERADTSKVMYILRR